jgi:hypothetical protein
MPSPKKSAAVPGYARARWGHRGDRRGDRKIDHCSIIPATAPASYRHQ